MRQKKSFWCLIVVTLVAALPSMMSCSKDDNEDTMLELSADNILLNNSEECELYITSNTLWEIGTSADWLSFTSTSGAGNGRIVIRATKCTTNKRTAIITVKGQNISRQLSVTQTAEGDEPYSKSFLTFTVKGTSFNMVFVEGGTFQMGATAEQDTDAEDNEKPVHSVTLSNYYIGETEVTQGLWQAVMVQKPTSDGEQWNNRDGLGSNKPAYYISWNDCQDFIKKLNALTGRTFRMPTEAEWEYAARGGNKSKGYKYAGSNTIDDVAWYYGNSNFHYEGNISVNDGSHDVATKQPNELGIYDMSGNVFEWCNDKYGNYSSEEQKDPSGSATSEWRVYRGGGWLINAKLCRVSWRGEWSSYTRSSGPIGFRLALR